VTVTSDKAPGGFVRTILAGPGGTLARAFECAPSSRHASVVEENRIRRLRRVVLDRDLPNTRGSYELISIGSQVKVIVEDLRDVGPRQEVVPGEDLLSFHMRLVGEFIASFHSTESIRYQAPHVGSRFQPRGAVMSLSFPAVPVTRAVTIFCEREFVFGELGSNLDSLPQQARQLLIACAPDFSYCALPVSAEIIACASAVLDNPITGPLRLPYSEAKVMELLTLALRSFAKLEDSAVQQFSDADIRRFHRAREILSRQFNPPPTITSLARELAINETKLKTGFRVLFSGTVFDFGHQCRMQHAMELLRDKRMRIGGVAEAVGYQQQRTFASAFKAHFGVRPRDARQPPGSSSDPGDAS
jgi:AraC-like DNA-binding protein